MRRCAFLPMAGAGLLADDGLALAPLRELGCSVDAVPWRGAGIDWGVYEVVLIRSPWNYHRSPDDFVRVLKDVEFSLFYSDGDFSHAILKTPAADDFRVQEEHGGRIRAVPAEAEMLALGDSALEALAKAPLCARVDCVRGEGGEGFRLMELELIEPALYFGMDRDAPRRFAEALSRRAGFEPPG